MVLPRPVCVGGWWSRLGSLFLFFPFDHGVAVERHVGIGQFKFARGRRKLCLRSGGRPSCWIGWILFGSYWV